MNQHIRKAVGAIILHHNAYLLVHKVKIMNAPQGPVSVPGMWDFPKGGIHKAETESEAVLRELREETGSQHYRIIKQFAEKICFAFDKETHQLTGYEQQEATMFLVEYLGDRTDLHPQDDEIDQVCFIPAEQVLHYLSHDESKQFYEQLVLRVGS